MKEDDKGNEVRDVKEQGNDDKGKGVKCEPPRKKKAMSKVAAANKLSLQMGRSYEHPDIILSLLFYIGISYSSNIIFVITLLQLILPYPTGRVQ